MSATIIDRGRGPEIAGTRITVYDILDYAKEGWQPSSIAFMFELSTEQVLAALKYIEDHKEAVLASYGTMLERERRGNPPAVQKKLDASHARFMEMVKNLRRSKRKGRNAAGTGGPAAGH